MTPVRTENNNEQPVADQALQWFVLLRSGNATGVDRRQFESWLGTDAIRQHEFEKLSRLWADLDATKPLLRDELTRAAVDWESAGHRPWHRAVRGWNAGWVSSALAALLLVIITGGSWVISSPEVMEYHTAKGEQRTVVLSDGSRMVMNTATTLTTELSATRRTVVLRTGEAFFAVSHDTKRPFEVVAGNAVARDVGTQFVVRRQDEKVTVTVVEGAVEVQHLAKAARTEPVQSLTAGEQVSYEEHGSLSLVEKVSLAASTAWMEGKVMFEERPLAEVIQEVGRYQAGEIRILDPRLESFKVSGVFGVNDRDGLLKALESAVPVTSSHVNRDVVILEQKNSSSAGR